MPNEHGQITQDDFKAPEGQFRIMKEEMSDGNLEIVADIHRLGYSEFILRALVEGNDEDVFTLCDDQGKNISGNVFPLNEKEKPE